MIGQVPVHPNMSTSKIVLIGAVSIAVVISVIDAATFTLNPENWLVKSIRYPVFPGVFGAWMLNLMIFGQHSVASSTKEFVFSLSFNVLCWWLLSKLVAIVAAEVRGRSQ